MGERLTLETIDRLRMWALVGLVACSALIIGLSNAVWSADCGRSSVLGDWGFGFRCTVTTGVESEVVVGFGDGRMLAGLGLLLLVTCAMALAFRRSAGTWMVWAAIIGLTMLPITGSAAIEYGGDGSLTQALTLLTGVTIAVPLLAGLFIWLDIKYERATTDPDGEAWA